MITHEKNEITTAKREHEELERQCDRVRDEGAEAARLREEQLELVAEQLERRMLIKEKVDQISEFREEILKGVAAQGSDVARLKRRLV